MGAAFSTFLIRAQKSDDLTLLLAIGVAAGALATLFVQYGLFSRSQATLMHENRTQQALIAEVGLDPTVRAQVDGQMDARSFYEGQLLINRMQDIFDRNIGFELTLPQEKNCVTVFAVVGRFNVGKTFIVNAVARVQAEQAMATGDNIHTQGVSFKFIGSNKEAQVQGQKVLLDSEGIDTSVTRFKWGSTRSKEQLMTGTLLQECASVLDFQRNVMFNMADGAIIVVGQVTCTALTETFSIYRNKLLPKDRVVLVHNLRDTTSIDDLASYKKSVFEMYPAGSIVAQHMEDGDAARPSDHFQPFTFFKHCDVHGDDMESTDEGLYAGLTHVFLGKHGTPAGAFNELAIKVTSNIISVHQPTRQTLALRTAAAVQQVLPQYVELPASFELKVETHGTKLFANVPPTGMPKLIHREVSDQLTRATGRAFGIISLPDRYEVVVDVPGIASIEQIGKDQIEMVKRGDDFTIKFPVPRPQNEGTVTWAAPDSTLAGSVHSTMTIMARMVDVNHVSAYTRDNAVVSNGQLRLPFMKQVG
jgi:hypothetical protein